MIRLLAVSVYAGIVSSQALAVISGDWEYIVVGGNATIIKYSGGDTNVIVPSVIDGYSVKEIRGPSDYVPTFNYSPATAPSVSVVLPNTLTNLGKFTFYSYRSLMNVSIPNSVTAIGDFAFWSCVNLTNVSIPTSVKSIGSSAFGSCGGLTNIIIPNSVTNFGSSAFANCQGLRQISIPAGMTSISDGAFANCFGLSTIIIPNTVTNISANAFASCYAVTNVMVGSGITQIGYRSFGGMLNLSTMTFLGNAPSVASDPFFDTPPFTLYYTQGTTGWGSTFTGRQTTLSGNFSLTLSFETTKGAVTNSPLGSSFSPGTTVSLNAIPFPGYAFTSWSGDSTSTNNPLVMVMASNRAITANFSPDDTDTDGDGLNNYQEVIVFNTNPNQAENNSPVAGLYLASDKQAERTAGRNDVLVSPNSYGLFNTSQILDLKFGGMVLGKSNGQLVLTYQINQSTNLTNWTLYREESVVITNAPADKMFLRILPIQSNLESYPPPPGNDSGGAGG